MAHTGCGMAALGVTATAMLRESGSPLRRTRHGVTRFPAGAVPPRGALVGRGRLRGRTFAKSTARRAAERTSGAVRRVRMVPMRTHDLLVQVARPAAELSLLLFLACGFLGRIRGGVALQ